MLDADSRTADAPPADNRPSADALDASPSGLLTRAGWIAARLDAGEPPPRGACHRQFARWVHAEARTLAGRLEPLLRADSDPALADPLERLIDALARDAEWARAEIDGR